jgi:peptidoglycan/xylan/chitin deacetylase (PgdA/CDA1 family)
MSRRRLASLLDYTGTFEAILRVRAWSPCPWLTVLTYHRIHEDPSKQLFDRGVIDATPDEFRRQLRMVKRHFSVIQLGDFFGFLRGRPLPPNPALITFDDGYRECFDRALPLLLEEDVRATFFVATSYISDRRVFWWDRISYIAGQTERETIQIDYPKPQTIRITGNRTAATAELLAIPKRWFGLDLERFLSELGRAAEVAWDPDIERRFAEELIMNWDQVRALRAAGMDIQSHTRTHRVLQTLRPEELQAELVGAKADLEQQLQEPVRAVSYPTGRSIAQSPNLRRAVADAGYHVGFSNMSGVTPTKGDVDRLDVRRISVETELPDSFFRAFLALPAFAESA